MKNKFLILGLILYFIAAALSIGAHRGLAVGPLFPEIVRWIALACLLLYAFYQRSLTTWILVCMVLGAELGNDFPHFAVNLRILSQIFLQMIRVIIAPLLFATLVSGIGGHSDIKKVGRLGLKSIIYFEIVTTLALVIGLAAINISKAGVGVQLPPVVGVAPVVAARPSATEMILHIFPENIAKSVAENQVLQVVVFSMIFGIALALVKESKRKPMIDFANSLAEVMFKFTNIVMLFAPIGIAGAIAYTIATTGFGVLYNLGQLVATLYIAFAVCAVAGDHRASSGSRIHQVCYGARDNCVQHHQFGSRSAQRHGIHGSLRRASRNCGLCNSHRIQFQPDRRNVISRPRINFCGASRRNSSEPEATTFRDARVDVNQQRRSWSFARLHHDSFCRRGFGGAANGTDVFLAGGRPVSS
jgi:hypothetical protein